MDVAIPKAIGIQCVQADGKVEGQAAENILESCSPMYEAQSASREPQAKAVPFLEDEIARGSRAKTG